MQDPNQDEKLLRHAEVKKDKTKQKSSSPHIRHGTFLGEFLPAEEKSSLSFGQPMVESTMISCCSLWSEVARLRYYVKRINVRLSGV